MQGTRKEAGVAPKMMQSLENQVSFTAGDKTAVFLELAVGCIEGGYLMFFFWLRSDNAFLWLEEKDCRVFREKSESF